MIDHGRRRYHGVLDIPEGIAGEFRIEHTRHPAGHVFELANARTAFLGGDKPRKVRFREETRWHSLCEGKGIWMTDLPIEQGQIDALLSGMRGDVLVGGLGLGYAATVLAQRKTVRRVVVVEKAAEVIALVEPHLLQDDPAARAKLTVIPADLFAFVRDMKDHFTHAFYDVWASDSEHTFHTEVAPLHALSEGKVKHHPRQWNERVMRGQLAHSLEGRLMYYVPSFMETFPDIVKHHPPFEFLCEEMPAEEGDESHLHHNWAVPFFRWLRESGVPREEWRTSPVVRRGISMYAGVYGLRGWTAVWETWRGYQCVPVKTAEANG